MHASGSLICVNCVCAHVGACATTVCVVTTTINSDELMEGEKNTRKCAERRGAALGKGRRRQTCL